MWAATPARTHWDGCEWTYGHDQCVVTKLCDEIDRLRAANLALAERLACCSADHGATIMTTTDPLTVPADETLDLLWLSIEAAPDDSLPRLVYADKLEELGCYDLAAACRATADKWPGEGTLGVDNWYWVKMPALAIRSHLSDAVFNALTGGEGWHIYRDYRTAREAVLDLWRAWVLAGEGVRG